MNEPTKVLVSNEINARIEDVWKIIGAYNWLPVISSATASSELLEGGRMRMLVNNDGGILWELLRFYDHSNYKFTYEIVDEKGCEAMAYGTGYIGTVTLRKSENGENTIFQYEGVFVPREGTTEDAARNAVENFANDCTRGLQRALAQGSIGVS